MLRVFSFLLIAGSLANAQSDGFVHGRASSYSFGDSMSLIVQGPTAAHLYKSLSGVRETPIQDGIYPTIGKKAKSVTCMPDRSIGGSYICYITVTSIGIK